MHRRRRATRVAATTTVTVLALVTAACGRDADTATTASVPTAAQELTGNPAEHSAVEIPASQITAAVASLDTIVTDAMAESGVPGVAVAVVHDDQTVYLKGFGVRESGSDAAVDQDTVFQLASLSKPVAATVVASVAGEGIVEWDAPVTTFLPAFALSDPYVTANVTIADLFSHRSGLPDHAGDVLEDLGYNQAEILARLRFLPLDPFRAQYLYTNFGFTAAAEAVAAAAGTSWPQLARERIYEPLGMTSTSSTYADYESAPNKAITHAWVDGRYAHTESRDPQAQSPAGGVSSSAADMAKWLRLALASGTFDGRTVVDPDALATSRVPHIATGQPASASARPGLYGLGIGVGTDETGRMRYSHSGAFLLGAATTMTLLPSESLGIVVLTNAAPRGTAEAIAASFLDLVETGRVNRDWLSAYQDVMIADLYTNPSALSSQSPPSNPTPSPALSDLAGNYANDYYGPAQVVARGDTLVMILGPEAKEFPLTHWSGLTYSYEPTGENALGISAVDFAPPVGGEAPTMTVEFLNADGLGTFVRQPVG